MRFHFERLETCRQAGASLESQLRNRKCYFFGFLIQIQFTQPLSVEIGCCQCSPVLGLLNRASQHKLWWVVIQGVNPLSAALFQLFGLSWKCAWVLKIIFGECALGAVTVICSSVVIGPPRCTSLNESKNLFALHLRDVVVLHAVDGCQRYFS